jgi:protein involved in polysaccharide export with SLBB domain
VILLSIFQHLLSISFAITVVAVVAAGQSDVVRPTDRIHPGDLIEIDELGGFDFDWRGSLNPEGFLDGFEKITDPIFGRCKSPEELAESVRSAYSKTLREPRVRVRILDRSRRPIAYLEGAIKQPLRLQIRREVLLGEIVVVGGGFTDRASGEVTILRPPHQSCESETTDATEPIKVKIADILAGDRSANVKILSGDLVLVEEVQPIYVIGGIARPGKQDWREGSTVSRIVAAAGGISNRGVAGSVTIFRREAGSSRVLHADLDAITAGKAADVEVKAFDIIDVPLKGQPSRTTPPVVEDRKERPDRRALPMRIID